MRALTLLLLLPTIALATPSCDNFATLADKNKVLIPGDQAIYKVTGNGRLYFHRAPRNDCIETRVFIIPGDEVIVYADYKGYAQVMYIQKNGGDVEGWLSEDRLKPTGTGIAPKSE